MDDLICKICLLVSGKDLSKHIKEVHKMRLKEYKDIYGEYFSKYISEKRKQTCLLKYGNENYKNEEARKLSFELYEGGHPLRDPSVRRKAEETSLNLYGEAHYTNREKAKQTNKERYGVEYTCAAPKVIEKRIRTLIDKYGKVFNISDPHNKIESPDDFITRYNSGETISKLSSMYGVSEPTVCRWISELNLKRSAVLKGEREEISPVLLVISYFKTCAELCRILSFYEYGKIKGSKYTIKLKRLFNSGKKFSHLKQELFDVALKAELQKLFLDKLL